MNTAKDYFVRKLPELTWENLDAVMTERFAETKNEHTVIPMLWQGLLELDIPMEGMKDRTAKIYVPRNCPQATNFVAMNTPEGENALTFIDKSGWMRKADENGLCLFVLEPGADGWKTPDEEMTYIQSGYNALRRGIHLLAGFADFIVGYGPIGSCLQRIAMRSSLRTAAAAFLDASEIPETEVRSYQKTRYSEPNIFGPVREYDLINGDIPVPVWILSKKLTSREHTLLDYWKTAAKAGISLQDDTFGTVYSQTEDSPFAPEGHILKVAVKEETVDYTSEATTEAILSFLLRYYRYGQGACSNMISKRIDYRAMGVEYRWFTDSNGYPRQYLVYIPAVLRNTGKKLPTVINFHGAQQSMENMLENGLWYRIADEKGLMIVCPECVLGNCKKLPKRDPAAYPLHWKLNDAPTPDRVFVNDFLDHLIKEFPVDEKRIYADGHSMGCMMTNYLASGPISHRFAAFCGTSGAFVTPDDQDVGGVGSPMWVSYGEYDMFGPAQLEGTGQMMDMISFWLKRNGFANEENVEQVRSCGADEVYVEGRYHHFIWKNKKGIPIFRYSWVEKKAHTHTPEENVIFWNNWLSKWSLDENGKRLYEGGPID